MASLDSINPGQMIKIKVVKRPTRAGASKTLARVLSKDADVAAENARRKRLREVHYNPTQRGGRLWGGFFKLSRRPVEGKQGEEGTVRATMDVLRDLKRVDRFIEITPA